MLNTNSILRKLKMKKVIFDSNMITTRFSSGSYDVYYLLYYDSRPIRKDSIYIPKDPTLEYNVKRNSNTACFAGVKNTLQSYVNPGPYCKDPKPNLPIPNRIYYKMNFKTAGSPKLKRSERYTWLELCKQYNLLPNYVIPSTVITGKVVFDMNYIPPSLLYTYLTMMRAIVEYPAFVRAVVYLVNKLKMNFYAAFIYASKYYISNFGHHIINPVGENCFYSSNTRDITKMKKIEFHLMASLKKFSENPEEFDNRHITDLGTTHWRCSDTIRKISKITRYVDASDLFKPSLEKAIEAKTEEEAQKHLLNMCNEPSAKIILKDLSIKKNLSIKSKIAAREK